MSITSLLLAFILGLLLGGMGVGLWRLGVEKKLERRLAQAEAERLKMSEQSTFLRAALQRMEETFQAQASRVLQASSDQLVKRSQEQMQAVVQPLHENLLQLGRYVHELERKREGAYSGLQTEISHLNEAYLRLDQSTQTLAEALKSSRRRGRWGEMQLRRVVELAEMQEHVDFDVQVSQDGLRPDMVIRLPNRGLLPVDAKAPLDAYLRAVDDPEARDENLSAHAAALRTHIRALGKKAYWQIFDPAPEFVVLFLPGEAILSAAFQADAELLDYAASQHVILTSPVTLLALLKTVAYGWMQNGMAENARDIARQGQELYERLGTLTGHLTDLSKYLGQSVSAYNRVVGALESRVAPAVRRLRAMGVSENELTPPPALDERPRQPDDPFAD